MNYPYFQISKKSGYAIRGLLELALRGDEGPVNVRTLAQAQDIPIRFLEIILNELKQGGFAREAKKITVGQIIQFLDRHMKAHGTAANAMPHHGDFVLSSMLDKINRAVCDICDETSLKDMVAEEMRNQSAFISNYII
ncbi:MAG: RrF2 family transcriptional regulator [Planctomycetota bacterium]|jgi:Rrf2 family protein